jgi:hypothetical protein
MQSHLPALARLLLIPGRPGRSSALLPRLAMGCGRGRALRCAVRSSTGRCRRPSLMTVHPSVPMHAAQEFAVDGS